MKLNFFIWGLLSNLATNIFSNNTWLLGGMVISWMSMISSLDLFLLCVLFRTSTPPLLNDTSLTLVLGPQQLHVSSSVSLFPRVVVVSDHFFILTEVINCTLSIYYLSLYSEHPKQDKLAFWKRNCGYIGHIEVWTWAYILNKY